MKPQLTLTHLITKKVILKSGIPVHRHFFRYDDRKVNDKLTLLVQLYDGEGKRLNETSFELKKVTADKPASPLLQLDDILINKPKSFRYRTRNSLLRVSDVETGTMSDQYEDLTAAGPIA